MLTHSECEGVYVIKKKKKRLHAGWRGGLISVRGKCQSFLPSFMCDISIGQFPGLKLCRRVDMKRGCWCCLREEEGKRQGEKSQEERGRETARIGRRGRAVMYVSM